jgi:sugar porter (SP) family MFS transporter
MSYNTRLFIPAIFAALGGFLFGYDTGVISSAIVFLKESFSFSPFEEEMIVGILSFGAILGAMIGGPISDTIGRKKTILISSLIYIIAAFLQAFAPTISMLILGRLIVGTGIGISVTVGPLYIAELAYREKRGMLVICYQLAITIGILVSYYFGFLVADTKNWPLLFLVAAVPAATQFLGMLFLPESPRWFIGRGRREEARAILKKYRSSEQDVELEIKHVEENIKHNVATWEDLTKPVVKAALLVGVTVTVVQQATGINAVLYYAPTIFEFAGFSIQGAAFLASTAIGVFNVLMTILAFYLIDRVGRRPLLLVGLTGIVCTLVLLSIGFLLDSDILKATITLIALILFVGFFATSLGAIGFLLNSEIYPLKVRGKAMGIAICANWAANFIITASFLTLINTLGKTITFSIYAIIGFLGFLFVLKKVPETKGKSLEEIENFFESTAKS